MLDSINKEFAVVCFVGLAVLGGIVSWLSLFINIALLANVLILIGAIIIVIQLLSYFKLSIKQFISQAANFQWYYKLLFLLGVVFSLYLSTYPSITLDEGTYHAQFIRWLQEYGTVVGLGNIEYRMAFNSHWHVLTSLFNWSYITTLHSNHINGVLYILMLLFCFSGFKQAWGAIRFFKTGMLVLCSLPHMLVYYIIAPSADLLSLYFIFIIFILAFEDAQKNNTFRFSSNIMLISILAVFLSTAKLSAAIVCVFSFIPMLYLFWKKQYKTVGIYVTINLFFLLPWFARNIILSGYLIYPLAIDLFNLDWEVSTDFIVSVTQNIKECSFNLYTPNAVNTEGMPLLQKYYTWFVFNIRIYDKLIISAAFILQILSIFKLKKKYTWLYIWLWLGLLFWLIQAPDPRFGYGYLACALLFGTYYMLNPCIVMFPRLILSVAIITTFCFQGATLLLYNYLYKVNTQQSTLLEIEHKSRLIIPAPYLSTKQNPQVYQNKTIYMQGLSWAEAFPCIPDTTQVQFRGQKMEDGFQQKSTMLKQ